MDVTLYTRANCPLCEKAKAAIRASGMPVRLTEIDIDRDETLRARYTDDVPVVFIDGREAFRHTVDPLQFAAHAAFSSLASERCIPCRGDVPPLDIEEAEALRGTLGEGWRIIDAHHLEKTFSFADFATALEFTNAIGAVAEEQGHHPDIHLSWGAVRVEIWTHKIDGLTRSDFVLAAKVEKSFTPHRAGR